MTYNLDWLITYLWLCDDRNDVAMICLWFYEYIKWSYLINFFFFLDKSIFVNSIWNENVYYVKKLIYYENQIIFSIKISMKSVLDSNNYKKNINYSNRKSLLNLDNFICINDWLEKVIIELQNPTDSINPFCFITIKKKLIILFVINIF